MSKNEKWWKLDSNQSGCDEYGLLGTYEEVEADILNYHDLKKLPEDWCINEMDESEKEYARKNNLLPIGAKMFMN